MENRVKCDAQSSRTAAVKGEGGVRFDAPPSAAKSFAVECDRDAETTFEERYERLAREVRRQPLNAELLRIVLGFCEDPRTFEEIGQAVDVPETSGAIIDAPRAVRLLIEHGGLSVEAAVSDPDGESQTQEPADFSCALTSWGSVNEGAAHTTQGAEDLDSTSASFVEGDTARGEVGFEAENGLPAADPLADPRSRYISTDIGIRLARENVPASRLEALLRRNEARARVYKLLLEVCAATSRKLSELEHICRESEAYRLVNENAKDGISPSTLVGDLERAGGIAWQGAWGTTEAGRAFLDAQGERG